MLVKLFVLLVSAWQQCEAVCNQNKLVHGICRIFCIHLGTKLL